MLHLVKFPTEENFKVIAESWWRSFYSNDDENDEATTILSDQPFSVVIYNKEIHSRPFSRLEFHFDGGIGSNHGCTNYAIYTWEGGEYGKCTFVESCHHCWQAGHDHDYKYDYIQHERSISYLIENADYIIIPN